MAAAAGRERTALTAGAFLPAILPAVLFAAFATVIPDVAGGKVLAAGLDWVPSLGVRLSFLIDGLSLTFALLITGIGALVLLYSGQYLGGHAQYGRFVLYLTAFMLAMLGLVAADNLITLFVFWELTTLTSYLLIGFDHGAAKSRRSALQALLVTATGGLALLAGFILMGLAGGSFELSELLADPRALAAHPWYPAILVLVLLGAFTKSAQVPFHFWLPNAMAAPTPVSAYLHSATMVKGGVYLLARLHPGLGGTDAWFWALTVAGAVTAVFASLMALGQRDLKQMLAYTTLMALGTLTLFLASDVEVAVTAAVTFLIVHSLYKAALFLVVGIVDHATGTRDVERLSGLARALPVTAAAAALSALSMAGFPPFLGFIGKELTYKGALALASEPYAVAAAVLAANALMVAVAAMVALRPFWGRAAAQPEPGRTPREAPWPMWIGPALLAVLGTVFGLRPALAEVLVRPAVTAVLPGGEAYVLKLWHGVNVPLALSVATFLIGGATYALRRPLAAALTRAAEASPIDFDRGWDRLLDAFKAFAAWLTRIVQPGLLRVYLRLTFLTLLAAMAGTLLWRSGLPAIPDWPALAWRELSVLALIAGGTGLVIATESRVAAVAGLGVVGIGVALVFIVYGAPDVAITQLLVETLVVVLVAVALLRLPFLYREGRVVHRPWDALLAAGLGLATTAALLLVVETPPDRKVTDYYEAAAVPEAYGRNIVNVVLVDFRALDTLGEIAVVLVAALGALVLLRGAGRARG
jgi:multicomponent Na+:H+ antiporter subunit A